MVRKSTVRFLAVVGLVAMLFCGCGFEKNCIISELFGVGCTEYSILDNPDSWITKSVFEKYEEFGLSIELSQEKRSTTVTPLEDMDIRTCVNSFKEMLYEKDNKYYGILVQGDETYLKNINFCVYYDQSNKLVVNATKFEYGVTTKDN